jgi:hypothetical protein
MIKTHCKYLCSSQKKLILLRMSQRGEIEPF